MKLAYNISFEITGYTNVSSNPYLAYRSEHFPGLGYLMPIRVFEKYLENSFSSCCSKKWVFLLCNNLSFPAF